MELSVILAAYRIAFTLKKTPETSSFLRWKNIKEIIISHKGTRMVEDGED